MGTISGVLSSCFVIKHAKRRKWLIIHYGIKWIWNWFLPAHTSLFMSLHFSSVVKMSPTVNGKSDKKKKNSVRQMQMSLRSSFFCELPVRICVSPWVVVVFETKQTTSFGDLFASAICFVFLNITNSVDCFPIPFHQPFHLFFCTFHFFSSHVRVCVCVMSTCRPNRKKSLGGITAAKSN